MKENIYIDFEAITPPFSWKLKWSAKNPVKMREIPFAYCLGAFDQDGHFQIKTTVLDFHKIRADQGVFRQLKYKIWNDIQDLKPELNNINQINFVGFAANLEKTILKKVFNRPSVESLEGIKEVSLSKLTYDLDALHYFPYMRTLTHGKFSADEIRRMNLEHPGMLASYTGSLFFCQAKNLQTRYFCNFDFSKLMHEFKQYLSDDVLRMAFIVENRTIVKHRFDYILEQRKISYALRKEHHNLVNLQELIKNEKLPQEMTIAQLNLFVKKRIKLLDKKLEKQKEKENLKDNKYYQD